MSMLRVVRVCHWCDARTREDVGEQLLELLELRRHLLKERVVVVAPPGSRCDQSGRRVDLPREIEHERLARQNHTRAKKVAKFTT